MRCRPARMVALLALTVSACTTRHPTPPPAAAAVTATTTSTRASDGWFEDKTHGSSVQSVYSSGRDAGKYTILESVGGGVALLDFDQDGDLDLFFPGGGTIDSATAVPNGKPSLFYRNDGDWRFADITAAVGLGDAPMYSHGVAVADIDRDGAPDLLLTGYGGCRLYRNDGGKRFVDITAAAGLQVPGWSTAAVFADVDRDGWPDLYVCGYVQWTPDPAEVCPSGPENRPDVCPPQRYQPAADRLFRNQGDGTFADITTAAGIRADGKGLGVVAGDFNDDGWIDFYVANDGTANHLYWGQGAGKFRENGLADGVATNEYGAPEGSMGVDFGDVDGDGRGDLWVVNFAMEDNSLYQNLGGTFQHVTVPMGLGGSSRVNVGFGTALADFDSDGWLDLLLINGHVSYHSPISPFFQPSLVYRNLAGKRFAEVTAEAGPWFAEARAGRGVAVGDLDNDGGLDVVVVEQDRPASLLRNRQPPPRWLAVQLAARSSAVEAVGARVSWQMDGREVTRHLRAGGGYLSHSDSRVIIPVSAGASDSTSAGAAAAKPPVEPLAVTVSWPGGRREVFRQLSYQQTNILREGMGDAVAEP